ncbi:MAG: hypothetical protein R3345_00710 [Fulvivirga sp.]|nr:hypothetical protein [Fulvivirga sp.]
METATDKIISWQEAFSNRQAKEKLTTALAGYMLKTRWYAAKTQKAKSFKIDLELPLHLEDQATAYAITIEVNFEAGFTEYYFMTIAFCEEEVEKPGVISRAHYGKKEGYIIDALYWEEFRKFLFEQLKNQQKFTDEGHTLYFEKGNILRRSENYASSEVMGFDQSNTSIQYNNKYFLKIYRRLFQDTNPDYELTKYLSDDAGYKNSPRYAGSLSWHKSDFNVLSLGLMQEKIENKGEVWSEVINEIKQYFKRIYEYKTDVNKIEHITLFEQRKISALDDEIVDLIGFQSLKNVQKIAKRVAEMHVALFKNRFDTAFNPVDFNPDYSVWLKNRIMYQFNARYILVEQNLDKLDGLAKQYAERFLASRDLITNQFLGFEEHLLNSQRIRIHGDLHLGQILSGKDDDFYIIDFEGEPESTIRDRKVKQTPLKDVAGLLRSYHYAVYAVIFDDQFKIKLDEAAIFQAGEKYYQCVLSVFLKTYLDTAMSSNMDVGYFPEIVYLLKYHLLEKAVYEIGYELKSRPDWAVIPLSGINQILDSNLNKNPLT